MTFLNYLEPEFTFSKRKYEVDESDEYVSIKVLRRGPDLSMTSYVIFATKQMMPVSAKGMS